MCKIVGNYGTTMVRGSKVLLLTLMIVFVIFTKGKAQDTSIVASAFFGLDNAILNGRDGMPVNFLYSIDGATLDASDFEVITKSGEHKTPITAVLRPADESGENRTVLLIGDFGTAVTNPPVKVTVVGDLYTMDKLTEESAWSEVLNLNGSFTNNVAPLSDGPTIFFAQRVTGSIDECKTEAKQTIQVVWTGGVTPYVSGDSESDLFTYYIGYSDSAGTLIPHNPITIGDINDNDNFHQLGFATTDSIVTVSIRENVLQDPNGDPNPYTEVTVSYDSETGIHDGFGSNGVKKQRITHNTLTGGVSINNLSGDEYFTLYNVSGQILYNGNDHNLLQLSSFTKGIYFIKIASGHACSLFKFIKK